MIEKKNPKHSLEKNRVTVFTIGLLAAGSFTLAAFTYVSPIEAEEARIASNHSNVEYLVQESEPEKPVELKTKSVEIEDQEDQTTTLDAAVSEKIKETESTSTKVEASVSTEGLPFKKGEHDIFIKPKEKKPEIVLFPDKEAKYVGGHLAMVKFINSTLSYPQDAIDLDEQGRVQLSFVVEKDGSVTSVQVVRGQYKSLDREASRIIRKFPNWIPGEAAGKKVRTRVTIPIVFTLQ